jgi:hypothetical protein
MKKRLLILLSIFTLFLVSCSNNNEEAAIIEPVEIPFDFSGTFTVTVVKIQGETISNILARENEIITQINDSVFKTSTTGIYPNSSLSAATEFGFTFNYDNFTDQYVIPSQDLAGVYLNQVKGYSITNEPHGIFIDENTFKLTYEITHTSQVPYYVYTATYVRN